MIKYVRNEGRLSFPNQINVMVTERCDNHCSFCYLEEHNEAELSWQTMKRIVDQFAEYGGRVLQISGGDPLLYPYLYDSIRYAKQYGLVTRVSTSGKYLTENVLRELEQAGTDYIHVSLNGSTKKIHELTRDGFEETMNAIEVLGGSKCEWIINWVACHENIDDLEEVIILARRYGALYVDILALKSNKNHKIHKCNVQDIEVLYTIWEKYRTYIHIENCFQELKHLTGKQNYVERGCCGGRLNMSIDASGYMMPCPHAYEYKERWSSLYGYWKCSERCRQFISSSESITTGASCCRYCNSMEDYYE